MQEIPMRYQFPIDMTLDEVRAAVMAHNERLGAKSFIEADRGDHVIFNYVVAFAESFPTPNTGDAELDRQYAILRECRGLIFCKETGTVIRRPFHKFFNVNERAETQLGNLDFDQNHKIETKLDGSMIAVFLLDGNLIWATKMVALEFHEQVKDFVEKSEIKYEKFCFNMINDGYTPIFEWMSPENKIVIDYKEPTLVLTAVRHMVSGEFLPL